MLSLVRLESKKTHFSNPFRIHIFLFHSYLFGIETINTFTRPRSSLENHTRFQTKMGKVCTHVQTKTAQKNLPKAAHTYVAYLKKYPLGYWYPVLVMNFSTNILFTLQCPVPIGTPSLSQFFQLVSCSCQSFLLRL